MQPPVVLTVVPLLDGAIVIVGEAVGGGSVLVKVSLRQMYTPSSVTEWSE